MRKLFQSLKMQLSEPDCYYLSPNKFKNESGGSKTGTAAGLDLNAYDKQFKVLCFMWI